jgi:ribonuclease HII
MSPPRASRAIENEERRRGVLHVAGVDEVGRGCLAGPVAAGAVILDPNRYVPGIADSKTLSAGERERLFGVITRAALAWHVAMVEAADIDRLNIHQASFAAMRLALAGLSTPPGFVLVDGFRIPDLPIPQRAVIGGDRRSTAIAAASILAKVLRDRVMVEWHARDPRFGFDRHKGYATAEHLAALARYGYSAAHRRSFKPRALFDTIDAHSDSGGTH